MSSAPLRSRWTAPGVIRFELIALLSLVALPAVALPPASNVTAAAAAAEPKAGRPSKPPEPELPSANIKLTVVAPTTRRLWAMRFENTGDVPVRLVADVRLLEFDITTPGATKAVHCVLPPDMRPASDDEQGLVVPPRRAFADSFDPRVYCFGAKEADALVPGASVVARLGWPEGHGRRTAPYVVSGIDGVEPQVRAEKHIEADAFTLPLDTASDARAARRTGVDSNDGDEAPSLVLGVPARMDVARPLDVPIPVRITNKGTRSVTLLFRPEVVGFDVTGPAGATRCTWPVAAESPIRELYTTISPLHAATVDVLLTDLCQERIFDQPGLYFIRPRLDTSHASGAPIALRTFDGHLVGDAPMTLRVRTPRVHAALPRPKLE